jgi:non-canonical purine NTP pyrophosphatase, rdgB/HAM1 family
MKIYLASNNKHKYEEFHEGLCGVELVLPCNEGIEFSAEENGASFLENAIIKAKALYEIVHSPVIADDSGLCVDALDGRPGIFSARYAIPPTNEEVQDYGINRLLKEMEGKENRDAMFVCTLVLYMEANRFFVFQETCNGEITTGKKGMGGFGYDPIFLLKDLNKTMAELTRDEKNLISHRGRAIHACNALLQSLCKR